MSEKIVCPYGCGREISSLPGPMAIHKKKFHAEQPTVQPGNPDPVEPQKTETKVAPVAQTKPADAKMRDLMEKAKAAQDTFKQSPNIFVASQTSDEMLELRKMYLPESVGKNASMHCFFALESTVEQYAARGYAPVVHPVTGGFVRFNELVMLKLPIEIFNAMERKGQEASQVRMKRAGNAAETGHADQKLTGGASLSNKGLRVEEYSVAQQQLG